MDEKFWNNAPKIFTDNANMAVMRGTGNTFLLALCSGANVQVFAMTPEHMKRFSQLITYNLSEYERTDGEIKADAWTPGLKSPLSVKDLWNGPDERKN